MKTLDDLNPKIKKLLTSSDGGDIRIGVELLKRENLSDEELLWLLPDKLSYDDSRDIKSNYFEGCRIEINKNLELLVNSSWLVITEKDDE